MAAAGGTDARLALQLCAPIHAHRVGRIGFRIGRALGAVKDVIRRKMNQQRVCALGFFGQHTGRDAVDAQGEVRFVLRLVDGGVRGGVDDHARLRFPHHLADGAGIGEIECGAVGRDRRMQHRLELGADLAAAPGQQDLHGKTSASLSRGAAASRLERSGWPWKGQRMAMSGSSQRMTRSCLGSQKSVSL